MVKMIHIRFADPVMERKALGFLLGRFSFKTWANGDTIVPDLALPTLARENISFTVEGLATYEQQVSLALKTHDAGSACT
jgi:hypothetical protein